MPVGLQTGWWKTARSCLEDIVEIRTLCRTCNVCWDIFFAWSYVCNIIARPHLHVRIVTLCNNHRPRKHGVRGVNWPPTFSSAGSINVVWPPLLTGIVITAAHYLKHPDGWKTPRHLVRWLSAESLKLLPPDAPNSISAGALPQIPLGELTALPRPPSWI